MVFHNNHRACNGNFMENQVDSMHNVGLIKDI